MKHLAAVASLVAALALVSAALATPTKDYRGPSCTNIVNGDGTYSTFGGTEAVLRWDVQTETPTCKGTTYTLYVLDATGTTMLAQQSLQGGTSMSCPPYGSRITGDSCLSYTIDLGPASSARTPICIYGTSANGTKLNDRAPDFNCVPLDLTTSPSSPGGGFFG